MVISTHDVGFARTVADKIVFLKDGVLVEAFDDVAAEGHAQAVLERVRRL